MMKPFNRPLLAASLLPPNIEHTDENIYAAMCKLKYPVAATVKIDGIRAIKNKAVLLSRRRKLIPNRRLRQFADIFPDGFDMELANVNMEYHEVESVVMSEEHPDSDKINFHLIDWYNDCGYQYRTMNMNMWINRLNIDEQFFTIAKFNRIIPIAVEVCYNAQQLFNYFLQAEKSEGEGICFRTCDSPYPQKSTLDNRSTLKEQYLVKLSRYIRSEATIVGFIEQQENGNATKRNALGLMDRSKAKGGMYGKNTLGAFEVKLNSSGQLFKVATGVGLTDRLRKEIWNNRDKYVGKTIVLKHKPFGQKIKPRSPIFVGFRTEGY